MLWLRRPEAWGIRVVGVALRLGRWGFRAFALWAALRLGRRGLRAFALWAVLRLGPRGLRALARGAVLGGLRTLSLWAVLLLQRVELLHRWGCAMAARIWALVLVALSRSSAVAGGMRGGQVARWRRARWAKRALDNVQRCPSRFAIALAVGRGVVQRLRVA